MNTIYNLRKWILALLLGSFVLSSCNEEIVIDTKPDTTYLNTVHEVYGVLQSVE